MKKSLSALTIFGIVFGIHFLFSSVGSHCDLQADESSCAPCSEEECGGDDET